MVGRDAGVMLSVDIRKRLSAEFTLDVAFTAPAGITILFGASGSGKTTILRCLSGLARPDAGRIAVGHRTLFDDREQIDVAVQQRRVGYVVQQSSLFPHMSIERNVEYGLDGVPADDRRARVRSVADVFHITPLLARRPGQVSGGERQRAALARALVTDPSILLLDEPLSALDHAIQSRIIEDLRRWNEAHRIPIVYVTHGHREVFALGERVIVVEHGRVLASGSPHDVLDHPAQAGLASVAGFENILDAVVVERREPAGTMQCRLQDSATELEVPLNHSPIGRPIQIAIRAGDILVANHPAEGLSARNLIPGTVADLTRQGTTMVAAIDAGARFVVHLTPGGVESLNLHHGDRVWLIIKTYSCRIVAG
jgi:molybdate transport system ATP-binding protein